MNVAISLRESRPATVAIALSALLVLVTLLSLSVGAMPIPVREVAIVILKHAGLFADTPVDSTHEVVMNTIRLPRIVMTILIGAALGVSGACLQGLFRNPLVEPALIGVSGGSAALVVCVIVFGGTMLSGVAAWMYGSALSIAAFTGGCVATLLVLRFSTQSGKTNIAVLVLVGVAVNALTGALIGLAIFYADENQLNTFLFWTLGDLGGATWPKLAIAAPLLAGATGMLLLFAHSLNALSLGEAEAFHLGVNVERTKRVIILLCALCVGVSVSLAGMIGFVGLVVPHVIRTLFYPDNTLVLPASAIGGALLLLVADITARTVVRPAELPIGVVTALIGAPFFIALLMNAKRKHEL